MKTIKISDETFEVLENVIRMNFNNAVQGYHIYSMPGRSDDDDYIKKYRDEKLLWWKIMKEFGIKGEWHSCWTCPREEHE